MNKAMSNASASLGKRAGKWSWSWTEEKQWICEGNP